MIASSKLFIVKLIIITKNDKKLEFKGAVELVFQKFKEKEGGIPRIVF
jgi:hypothetical protein